MRGAPCCKGAPLTWAGLPPLGKRLGLGGEKGASSLSSLDLAAAQPPPSFRFPAASFSSRRLRARKGPRLLASVAFYEIPKEAPRHQPPLPLLTGMRGRTATTLSSPPAEPGRPSLSRPLSNQRPGCGSFFNGGRSHRAGFLGPNEPGMGFSHALSLPATLRSNTEPFLSQRLGDSIHQLSTNSTTDERQAHRLPPPRFLEGGKLKRLRLCPLSRLALTRSRPGRQGGGSRRNILLPRCALALAADFSGWRGRGARRRWAARRGPFFHAPVVPSHAQRALSS